MFHVHHPSSSHRPACRRRFLQSLCSLAGVGAVSWAGAARGNANQETTAKGTRDVTWLAEVQRRPDSVPRDKVGDLAPLLISAHGKPIEALEAWQTRRRELRDAWMKFLGLMPLDRPAVRLEVLREDHPTGCVRQLVQYEGEPGQTVQGYLLRPSAETTGKRAGIVGLHQTTNHSIDEIAGVSGPEPMQIGLKLAQRGFVVF